MPVRRLTPALAEKARKELGEEPNVLASSIQELKKWIAEQPHLKARTDDQWLAAFLRGCKFRLDQAKAKIDLYYSLRSTSSYLYCIKYDDPKVMDLLSLGSQIVITKTKNPVDPRVHILRPGMYNPKEYTCFDFMAVTTFQAQIGLMEDDNLTVAGSINIVDLRNTSLGHFTQAGIKHIRGLVYAHQQAVPMRIKEVHFVGAPYIFQPAFNIAKRFFNEKIRNRIHMHSNVEALINYVPKEVLPPEYGGTGPTIQENIDYWKRKFTEYRRFFEDDLQFGTDEEKRVKDVKKKELPPHLAID